MRCLGNFNGFGVGTVDGIMNYTVEIGKGFNALL
jgi:hypothetical protein